MASELATPISIDGLSNSKTKKHMNPAILLPLPMILFGSGNSFVKKLRLNTKVECIHHHPSKETCFDEYFA
jgi:hypothetical protein